MAIDRTSLIKGPGALTFGGQSWLDQDGIEAGVEVARGAVNSSLFGKVDEFKTDQTGTISIKPLGRLTADRLSAMFPYQLPVIGSSIFGAVDSPAVINSRAGKTLTFFNAAVTGIPELTLSASAESPLGSMELTALLANNKEWTDADAFYALVDEAFVEPAVDTTQIKRVKYSAAWGTVLPSIQSKDGWTISVSLETEDETTADYGTIDKTLKGVEVTAKCRPINLSEDILNQMKLQGAGAGIGASLRQTQNLVITGEGGLTVTLYDAMLVEGPLKWGQTELRAGEVMFVASRSINETTKAVGDLYKVEMTA